MFGASGAEGCISGEPVRPDRLITVTGADAMINDLWYKNAIVYCLSVGTYMDANGDGIGDFRGLMRRLDYLHGLGVTAVWLMPFQPSPCRTMATTYLTITESIRPTAPSAILSNSPMRAKQRGIRVIIDLVVNHTSDHIHGLRLHVGTAFEFRDWYVWAEKKPANANKGMVFPGVQKSTWSYDEKQRPGTSTASTIFNPISTPRIRTCRPKS